MVNKVVMDSITKLLSSKEDGTWLLISWRTFLFNRPTFTCPKSLTVITV